ncbi:hypothetical protein D3C80_1775020 [compost metagenome]
MVPRCDATAAAQHHLAGHELAVVFAQAAGQRLEARVGAVGAGGPFPDIAEHLLRHLRIVRCGDRLQVVVVDEVALQRKLRCRHLPFRFRGQPCVGPAGVGVGLVEAQVADRCVEVQRARAAEGQLVPVVVLP